MNKIKLLKIVNSLLLLSFLIQVITVVFLLLEKETEFIDDLHKYNGIILIVLALTHVALNWNWIKSVLFKK